jgi:hypothetical protein
MTLVCPRFPSDPRHLEDNNIAPLQKALYNTILYEREHDVEKVLRLLEEPTVNPSLHHNIALRCAVLHGRTSIVSILLADPRVNPADDNNGALSAVVDTRIEGTGLEIAKMLLDDERVANSEHTHVLDHAVNSAKLNIVKLLLTKGRIDINSYWYKLASVRARNRSNSSSWREGRYPAVYKTIAKLLHSYKLLVNFLLEKMVLHPDSAHIRYRARAFNHNAIEMSQKKRKRRISAR